MSFLIIIVIEKGNCVGKVYGIYGETILRTGSHISSLSLQQLVHEGIVHGLCNEIVIMPIMAANQNLQQADVIPFPLFMAEMLRRMRSSYFLLQTAMRYLLDIESEIRAARERAVCGWCRSGVYGCPHSSPPETGSTFRFAKGRSAILRKPTAHNSPHNMIAFSHNDDLHPLVDPRKAFLGALILANKFHRDRSIGNKAWAAMIGLQLEEVHSAERAVGKALGWMLSRPWVRDVRDDDGNWMPGSTHPSFAEPLFASTEVEATKYGVKALRDSGEVPPALENRQLATEFPRDGIHIDSICMPPQFHLFPLPDALSRRSRSQTISIAEDRAIAPLSQRPGQAFLQPRTKASGLIRKADSAPDVLQSSFHNESSLGIEIDMAMQSEWNTLTSKVALDNLMDATPTMEPARSKRKASQDFGPIGLIRRGVFGQRVSVQSLDEMAPAFSLTSTSMDQQWDMCDDESCPELSPATITTTSPSIESVTRTGTPSNLLEMATAVSRLPPSHKSRSWLVNTLDYWNKLIALSVVSHSSLLTTRPAILVHIHVMVSSMHRRT